MIIKHLKIENFRGIKVLDWHLAGRVLCLIGPNDSTKTTVLDAIELVLLPRWYVNLTDFDFYQANVDNPILIEATIGEIPPDLLVEPEKFGLYLRGYLDGEIHDDPTEGSQLVLTIRFNMDRDLDPSWEVFKISHEQPKLLRWKDRERIGLTRLGADADRHLTWARGSALAQLTEKNTNTGQAFVEVARQAKRVIAETNLAQLDEAATKAKSSTKKLGAEFETLKPGLDISNLSLGGSVLGLHDSNIPARLWGLGTRRLAALGVQQEGAGQDSILVVDEIEHGLEPHRIRHLLKRLTQNTNGKEKDSGQVILSTHSPTSIIELPVESLRFVRSYQGTTKITSVSADAIDSMQKIARSQSHAFLARKLLVCEGATEVGLCRGLYEHWATANEGRHPTHVGFTALDGQGTKAPGIAQELKRIGYDVALLADSDRSLEPSIEDLNSNGIPTFVWSDSMCTEERLSTDLPLSSFQLFLNEAYQEKGFESITGQVGYLCGIPNLGTRGTEFPNWLGSDLSEAQARKSVGKAAHKNSWFKNITRGTKLGEIVAEALPQIPNSPTASLNALLVKWVYE